jgi:predicted Zn finger-like uncharacterized protein
MPEIVNCPHCERKLRVPDELIGKMVKCPTCDNTFTASVAATGDPGPAGAPTPPREEPAPRPQPPRGEDFLFEDKPSQRPPRRDDDLELDDEPPSRRRQRGDYQPHRGVLILVFGIISIVVCPIFGPIAWVMGNGDLQQIRAGQMDPEGESMTNIGRILGMVGTGLIVLNLCLVCLGVGAGIARHR